MNDEAVNRAAPATPGLLNTLADFLADPGKAGAAPQTPSPLTD